MPRDLPSWLPLLLDAGNETYAEGVNQPIVANSEAKRAGNLLELKSLCPRVSHRWHLMQFQVTRFFALGFCFFGFADRHDLLSSVVPEI